MSEYLSSLLNPYFLTDTAGVLVSFAVLFFISKKSMEPRRQLYFSIICALIGLFLGAHIMYLIIHLPGFIRELAAEPASSAGEFFIRLFSAASGLTYFGGLFGAIAATALVCRIFRMYRRPYMNILAVLFPIYQMFGRIGCSLAGCCYGIEYSGPLAIYYDASYIVPGASDNIADLSRFPVQPLEAFFGLVLFFVMLYLYLKNREALPLMFIYLPAYSVIRFLDEFLRADEIRGIWGPLSASQWIALASIAVSVIFWTYFKRKKEASRI